MDVRTVSMDKDRGVGHDLLAVERKEMVGVGGMAIGVRPGILDGKPVIEGTRISVDLLLELVDAGLSVNDVLREYPQLKREDVLIVLQVARKGHEGIKYERVKSATEA